MLEKGSMSTANGHGLVDPKIWGKPVGFANKVERVPRLKRRRPLPFFFPPSPEKEKKRGGGLFLGPRE